MKWMDVSCGSCFTIAIDTSGRVWTVGDNKYGQLGRLLTESIVGNDLGGAKAIAGKKVSKFDSTLRIIPDLDYSNIKFD